MVRLANGICVKLAANLSNVHVSAVDCQSEKCVFTEFYGSIEEFLPLPLSDAVSPYDLVFCAAGRYRSNCTFADSSSFPHFGGQHMLVRRYYTSIASKFPRDSAYVFALGVRFPSKLSMVVFVCSYCLCVAW